MTARPPLGVTARTEVLDVYDADTVTIHLLFPVRIRLYDCWAPEIRTVCDIEKRLAIAGRDWLCAYISGRRAVVHVPTEHMQRLGDHTSLGRYLARMWVGDSQTELSAEIVAAGHARATKDEQETWITAERLAGDCTCRHCEQARADPIVPGNGSDGIHAA